MAKRYRAFISYSQSDKAFAKRVHKALETYTLPGGVRAEGVDTKSRRIGRLFRDDEEMGASPDLGATLRGALEDTEALIVICSRKSAASRWVDQEIAHFKRTGRADRIFAVIIDGAPDAGRESDQCFPPALRFEVDANGALTDKPSEPLGLDARTQSFERLRVRLIAGLLGLPFDDLWNRDRRRRRRDSAIAAAATLVVVGALSAVGWFWLQERISGTLLQARADAGAGRVTQAVARLRPFAGMPISSVRETLRAILGWAHPVSEQLTTQGGSHLISYRGAVMMMDRDGGIHDVSEIGGGPQRVLLARDGRRLVVIGENRTVVLDAATGAKLSEAENNSTTWGSYAFETPEGRLVILGVRPGSTLGAITYGAMTVSADGASAQRLDLTQMVALDSFWLGDACQSLALGLNYGGAVTVALNANSELAQVEQDNVALSQTTSGTLVWRRTGEDAGGVPSNPFEVESADLRNLNLFTEIGCESVAADTAAADFDPSIVEVLQIGALSPSTEGWRAVAQPSAPFRRMQPPPGEEPGGWEGWRSPPTPRGVAPESAAFDSLDGAALAFLEDHGNAGVRWAVCRASGGCVDAVAMHDGRMRYDVVRSPDGRFLLIALAGTIFDLGRLQRVTGLHELPTTEGAAYDFEPDQAQLTILDDGELIAYRPDQSGNQWTRVGEVSGASMPRSDAGFAGLVAFGAGRYLFARGDGAAARYGADGRAVWQVNYAGLGRVLGISYSANRRYVALVGLAGLRLIDAETGLALSGLLRPPEWPQDESEVADCVAHVQVSDAGGLRVNCSLPDGPRAAEWSPRAFNGDLAQRVGQMLCDADAGTSAEAALRRCLARP